VAYKLCRRIDTELSDSDRAAANEILRVMAGDAAELVRRSLAVTLRASNVLPRDVALKLADDVASIATPVLSFSPVFTDEELAEIVVRVDPVRQLAVAKRATLSEVVTDAIARHGSEEVVATAARNEGAQFSEGALIISLDRFRDSAAVTESVAYRDVLPASITEKLVHLVSQNVRQHLVQHHKLAPEVAAALSSGAQERATVDILDEIDAAPDVSLFVKHLFKQNRLTPSLLLRAATNGYMPFFEHAMAELAAVPHHRAWLLIHDAGKLGLRAVYERAGMPQRLLPAFRAAVDTFHEMGQDGRIADRISFQALLVERFLTQTHNAPKEDIDYLLERLDYLNANGRRLVNQPIAGAA
jgi:uncharacterized protein (DUF2336 family)